MIEVARTSETSVDNYFKRQNIPEHMSVLHTSTVVKEGEGRKSICNINTLYTQLQELTFKRKQH
jgi:3-dehydroquinate synthetase